MLDPMESMFLSILIEQQKEINRMKEAQNVSSGRAVQQAGLTDNMLDKKQ
jgi:hypothetical protein